MPYEYKILSPTISNGKVNIGFKTEEVKERLLFGKEKYSTRYVSIYQSELDWLNSLGKEGWELIQVDKNSYDSNIRNYYFKRLNRTLSEKRDDDLNEILNED